MNVTNPEVDEYLAEGCGRCDLVGTPECKVHAWQEELKALRRLLLECGLTEERKWGSPCYTHNDKNIAMIMAFKENCALSFLKGALLTNEHDILEKPGENSQSARFVRFTNVKQVVGKWDILKRYVFEAVEVERAGLKVEKRDISDYEVPEEFQERLDTDPELKAAFEGLTPGRQKGYLLYFAAAKQSKTREARIEKYIPKILQGIGFHDR